MKLSLEKGDGVPASANRPPGRLARWLDGLPPGRVGRIGIAGGAAICPNGWRMDSAANGCDASERFALVASADALRGIVAARFAPSRPLSGRTPCPRSASRLVGNLVRAQLARRSALFALGASFARGFASRRVAGMFHVKHLFA